MNRVPTGCVCVLASLLIVGSGARAAAQTPTWVPLGPNGGAEANRMYASPQANTFFAPLSNDDGGLFKTTDGGASWTSITVGICDLHVYAVAIHPTQPNTIYAATGAAGVCKSTDGGTTWTALTTGLPIDGNGFVKQLTDIAINPATPSRLYVGTIAGVYASSDGGATWAFSGTSTAAVESIVIAPSAPSAVYASINNAVLVTTNDGTSWTTVTNGLSSVGDGWLTVDPTDAAIVYYSGENGLNKSTDGGMNWAPANTGLVDSNTFFVGKVAIDPANHNTLYVGAAGSCGLCKSVDGGATWSPMSATGLPSLTFGSTTFTNVVESVLIDPISPTRFFAGTPSGIFRSTNSGAAWAEADTGFLGTRVPAIGLSGEIPASVVLTYHGVDDRALLSRLAGGALPFVPLASTPIPSGQKGLISTIVVDPTNPNVIYALGGKASGQDCGQVFKTTDGGSTWAVKLSGTVIPASACGQHLTMDPTSSTTLYLSAFNPFGFTSFAYKTTDGANTWTSISTGFTNASGADIAVSPLHPLTLYACNGGQAFKSTNGGTSWSPTAAMTGANGSGNVQGTGRLAIDPTDDNIVYCATASGIFKTTTGGTSWTAMRNGWPSRSGVFFSAYALALDPTAPATLYASTGTPPPGPSSGFLGNRQLGGRLFKSTDGAATWTAVPGAISGAFVENVAFDGARAVYASTNNGVFRFSTAPTMTLDKTSLIFSGVSNGAAFSAQTGAQTVRLTQSGTGTVTWTAASNQPWLLVSPASGSGSGPLSIAVQFAPGLAATQTGTITITLTGAGNTVGPINVTLNTITSIPPAVPFGFFETPVDGTTGIAGSIAVTGWALDDVQVTRVTICRDAVTGETAPTDPNCGGNKKIYIGDGVFVDGARTDVQASFSNFPLASRAGWGYLMLTNFLPALGNGTFKLSAYAFDADGHSTLLGSKTIACDNASSIAPFGAIDTPGQGQVISGVSANFGWVLSPGSRRADPPGGGVVRVLVDGVDVGAPSGWTSRSDLSALFPQAQYTGVDTALAVFGLDTTGLTNGIHTIAWIVTATTGGTSGVGSRFFGVSNGSGLVAEAQAGALHARDLMGASIAPKSIEGRRGFDTDAPFEMFEALPTGQVIVHAEELDRIELLVRASAAYLQTPAGVAPLPVGAALDQATGTFVWMPGPGFVGAYTFTFVDNASAQRQDVTVVIDPRRSRRR